jgi:hypothetical protein
MSACPFCSETLRFGERAVRFLDDENGEDVELMLEAEWCGGCGEYQRVGMGGE